MFRVAHLLAVASTAHAASVTFTTYGEGACTTAATAVDLSGANDLATTGVTVGTETGNISQENLDANTYEIDTCYATAAAASVKFTRPADIGKLNCVITRTVYDAAADCTGNDDGGSTSGAFAGECTQKNGSTTEWFKSVCSEQATEAGTADFKAHVYSDATCATADTTDPTRDGRVGLWALNAADLTTDVLGFTAASYNANAYQLNQCYSNETNKSFKFTHSGCDATDGGVTLTKYGGTDPDGDCSGTADDSPAKKAFNTCVADAANTTGDSDDSDASNDFWYKIGTVADATACPDVPGADKFAAKHFSVVVALVAGVLVQLL